jgi:hypothetical protein
MDERKGTLSLSPGGGEKMGTPPLLAVERAGRTELHVSFPQQLEMFSRSKEELRGIASR